MTAEAAVRLSPTEQASSQRAIGRAALFAGVGVLAAINALADRIIADFSRGAPIGSIANLAGISAVLWFAMYAALKIGWSAERDELRKYDWPVALIVLASAIIPVSHMARGGLLLCALYAFATTRSGQPARQVALVLLALTGTLFWGPLILNIFAVPVLALDAHIVGHAIGSPVEGNVVQFAGSGSAFMIAKGCSSVHNISLAIVLWCTAVALFDLRIDARLIVFGVAMIVLMFGINILRLSLIGLFPEHFEFLHSGDGAVVFGWVGLIGMAILAGLGTHDALRRRS